MGKVIYILLISIILTGCMDKVELEKKSFVYTIGVDKGEDDMFNITLSIPSQINKTESKKRILKSHGESVTQAMQEANSLTSNVVDFRHAKVIILSKDIIEDEKMLKEIVDATQRNKQLSNKVTFIACEEKASSIVEKDSKDGKIIGEYISSYFSNNLNTVISPYNKDLQSILQKMSNNKGIVIPVIKVDEEDNIDFKKSLLLKDFQYISILDNDMTTGYNYIMGNGTGGLLTTKISNKNVTLKLNSYKNKIEFVEENDKLTMMLNIKTSGEIKEYSFGSNGLLQNDVMTRLTNDYEEMISKICSDTLFYFCKESKIDAIGLLDYLKKNNYELYEKYAKGKSSNDFLENLVYKVNVKLKVDNVGNIR